MKMKKKIIACLLAVSMVASLAIPAFAAAPGSTAEAKDATTVTFTDVTTSMSYAIGTPDADTDWVAFAGTTEDVTVTGACDIYVTTNDNIVGNSDGSLTADADKDTHNITQAAKLTTVGKTDCTSGNNGKLTSTTTGMEYSSDAGSNWIVCAADNTTNLTAGTYIVRTKATGKVLAGPDSDNLVITAAPETYAVSAPTVDPISEVNGLTATVAAIVGQEAAATVEVIVTLTGATATKAGTHTVTLTSTADVATDAITKETAKLVVTEGDTQAASGKALDAMTFTMPAKPVTDLTVTHTFVETTTPPPTTYAVAAPALKITGDATNKAVNGLTTSVANIVDQEAAATVEVIVTLTGATATKAGTHTVTLTSANDVATIVKSTAKLTVTKGDTQATSGKALDAMTFTMPAKAVTDLKVTHTFVEATTPPPEVTTPATKADFDVTNLTQTYKGAAVDAAAVTWKTDVMNDTKGGVISDVKYVGIEGTQYSANATPPTNAGKYNVTVDTAGGTGRKAMADLVVGTLTINKATLTAPVFAAGVTKVWNGTDAVALNSTNTLTFTGTKGSDKFKISVAVDVTGAKYATTDANGTIAITGGKASLIETNAVAKNYTLAPNTAITGNGAITKATGNLVGEGIADLVKAGDETKQTVDIVTSLDTLYGGDGAWISMAKTATYTPDTATDNDSILAGAPDVPAIAADGKLTYKLKAAAADGKTATIPVNVTSTNFDDFTVDVVITVTSKDVVTMEFNGNSAVTYNGADQPILSANIVNKTPAYTGEFDITYKRTSDNDTGIPKTAGSYEVTVVPVANDDYAGKLTFSYFVNKAPITVKADDKSITVGATLPASYTATTTGLVGGETFTVKPTVTCAIVSSASVATYPITVSGGTISGGGNANYDITYTPGTLTVLAPSAVTPPPSYNPGYSGGGSYSPSDTTADVSANTPTGTEATIDSSVTNIANPVLDVKPVAANAVEVGSFIKAASGFAVASVFQINMFDSTTVVKQVEGGKVEITLPFVAPDTSKQYVVLRYNDDKTITVIPATLDGSKIIFRTDHFSTFAVAVRSDNPNLFVDTAVKPTTPTAPTTVPATGVALLGKLF